jgi:hypothetical protein
MKMIEAGAPPERPSWYRFWLGLTYRPALYWLSLIGGGLALHVVAHFECPFRAATGWDCPVCGGTRALCALLHGHTLGAIRDNAAVLLVGVIVLLGVVPEVRASVVGRTVNTLVTGRSPFVWVGLIIAWTLVRNLLGLHWLSPDR